MEALDGGCHTLLFQFFSGIYKANHPLFLNAFPKNSPSVEALDALLFSSISFRSHSHCTPYCHTNDKDSKKLEAIHKRLVFYQKPQFLGGPNFGKQVT